MLRKMPQYSTLGGQHPPECQSNPASQGTFTTQKHSGTEGSACSGISINVPFVGISTLSALFKKLSAKLTKYKALFNLSFIGAFLVVRFFILSCSLFKNAFK